MGEYGERSGVGIHAEGASLGNIGAAHAFLVEAGFDLKSDITAQASDGIRRRVRLISRLIRGHDTIELLGNLRMVDIVNLNAGVPESERPLDHSHAVTEVIALVALALGLPRPPDVDRGQAAHVVAEVREHAAWILHAAQFSAVSRQHSATDPLDRLAARVVAGHLVTRGAQYESIARDTNRSFLERDPVRSLVEAELGFTPDDVAGVAGALHELQQSKIERSLRRLPSPDRLAGTPSAADVAAARAVFGSPQEMFTVTVDEVARQSGVATTRVGPILSRFSVKPPTGSPEEAVLTLMAGSNPFHGKGLIQIDDTSFMALSTALAAEHVRPTLEDGLPRNTPVWAAYDKARARWAEREAARLVSRLLGVAGPTHSSLRYLTPEDPAELALLASDGTAPRQGVKQVEADAIFVVDQVAFCIEVKAGSLSTRARAGDPRRLGKDLGSLVQDANSQAARLRDLILANGGVWTAKRRWIAFDGVREVHSIVVTLDDCGPVVLSMSQLIDAGLITTEQVPWVVSMHDLHVASDILEWAPQFLCYLRRRTHVLAARWLEAVDELDILMSFVHGHLYFESDPDEQPDHPTPPSDRVARRRRFREQGPTLVGTLTDDLDAWYNSTEGDTRRPQKPRRDEGAFVSWFAAWSQQELERGWLRFGATLVGLSSAGRRPFETQKARIVAAARSKKPGTVTFGGHDDTYSWLFFMSTPLSMDSLAQYLRAKKHQLHADLALGMVFDKKGALARTLLLDEPWRPDAGMDAEVTALVGAGTLMAPERSPAVIPPSARRETRRLRGRRGSSRRR